MHICSGAINVAISLLWKRNWSIVLVSERLCQFPETAVTKSEVTILYSATFVAKTSMFSLR